MINCLNTVGVIISHLWVGQLLSLSVHVAVDDSKGVKVYVICITNLGPCLVGNFHILLLKEGRKSGTVMPTIRLSPNADSVIVRLVSGEVLEPHLSKMPQSTRCIRRGVGSRVEILAGKGAHQESVVLLWHSAGEVTNDHVRSLS